MERVRTVCLLAAIFFAGVELALTISAFAHPPQTLRPGLCAPGSRSNVCIVLHQSLSRLGVNVIAVPEAHAVPEMVELPDQVWLQASGLPPRQVVTVALTAPDGTTCTLPADAVQVAGTAAQAFIVPADCADAEGSWEATITAGPITVSAGFRAVR